MAARGERQPASLKAPLAKPDPPILDELGYVPAGEPGAEFLLDAISTAYERTRVMVTANLPFEQRPEALGGERLNGAAPDRMAHRT